MSLEVECKVCGEEYDMRHGTCPVCAWRVKRVAYLEAEVERKDKCIVEIEAKNDRLRTIIETALDLDSRSSTREGWQRDIVKAVEVLRSALDIGGE